MKQSTKDDILGWIFFIGFALGGILMMVGAVHILKIIHILK